MKFTINNQETAGGRLGHLTTETCTLPTPLALLHTQGGHLPHITHEVRKLFISQPHILQIPLASMNNYRQIMAEFPGNVSEFIGSPSSLTYVNLQDPANFTIQGHHVKDKVPIFTRNGKIFYDGDKYMDFIEDMKPDMYCMLSDGDTNENSPNKRVSKAVDNTTAFIEVCIKRHKNSTLNSMVIAPIAGGYCLKARQKFLDYLREYASHFQGYAIDGLHNNGEEVEKITPQQIEPIVRFISEQLPPDKVRIIHGCFNPVTLIRLVKCGVDVFDSSYASIVTERSSALTFNYSDATGGKGEISLKSDEYVEDFTAILAECQCLSCKSYTKGYIHHLLTVQELLGPVLLMIHNVHHLLGFFDAIRLAIKEGTLDDLEGRIERQFNKC